jgi:hypothetical protein
VGLVVSSRGAECPQIGLFTRVCGMRTPTVVRQRTCADNAWVDRAPWARRRSEQRKRDAALRYNLESWKVGWGDPALI